MGSIAVVADGTQASLDALSYAVTRARDRGCALTGVFVIDAGWADFIGHDWQSSRNARQGFLDYVRRCQERDAESARVQFETAARAVGDTRFSLLVGDPAQALLDMMEQDRPDMLVLGRHAFWDCGRPSVKRLARTLERKATRRLVVI